MELPEKGYYYHYKHNIEKGFNDHAYEVTGVAMHTEDRRYTVIYIPLYKNSFLTPADYCARPLDMFNEEVIVNGNKMLRFTKITDSAIIYKLAEIKKTMYGSSQNAPAGL